MSGSRWTPSTIAWTTTSGCTSAAPTIPGSRWASGRIALKTWVTVRTPRSNAAFASAAVALVCPSETVTPRACSRSISSSAPGSSGASVTKPHGTRGEQALEQRGIGVPPRAQACACRGARGRGRGLRGVRRGSAGRDRRSGSRAARRIMSSSADVISVGRYAVTPVSRSASPAVAKPSASAPRKSTPAKPLTWRSTKPGAAIPRAARLEPDGRDRRRRRARCRPAGAVRRRGRPRPRASSVERLPHDASGRRRAAPAPQPSRRRRRARRSRPSRRRRPPRARRRPDRPTRRSRCATIRRTRERSLSFVATTSTIRLP